MAKIKRPLSSYQIYMKDQLGRANGNYSEVMVEAAKRWKSLTGRDRERFQKAADSSRGKWQQQKDAERAQRKQQKEARRGGRRVAGKKTATKSSSKKIRSGSAFRRRSSSVSRPMAVKAASRSGKKAAPRRMTSNVRGHFHPSSTATSQITVRHDGTGRRQRARRVSRSKRGAAPAAPARGGRGRRGRSRSQHGRSPRRFGGRAQAATDAPRASSAFSGGNSSERQQQQQQQTASNASGAQAPATAASSSGAAVESAGSFAKASSSKRRQTSSRAPRPRYD